jgi:2-polyprenyl-6-methoxyphenol hydroxylase-like FAD-dependent oxidoreductase
MYDVIIVGGGPVGLFLGLSLARQGIEVLVLEAEADIVPSPRALMYTSHTPRYSKTFSLQRLQVFPDCAP